MIGPPICPACKRPSDSAVLETRYSPYGIRRRRICNTCRERWTAVEIPAAYFLQLVDTAQALMPYLELLQRADGLESLRTFVEQVQADTTRLRIEHRTREIVDPEEILA